MSKLTHTVNSSSELMSETVADIDARGTTLTYSGMRPVVSLTSNDGK